MPNLETLRSELTDLRREAIEHHRELAASGETSSPALDDNRTEQAQRLSSFVSASFQERLALLNPELPLVLFPVRLETRFSPSTNPTTLLLRVYPDDVHVDTHEPGLTEAERDAGTAFWEQIGQHDFDSPTHQEARARLVQRFGPHRAAWVVRQTATNGRNDQTSPRSASWTRAPWTHALPDQWIVLGYDDAGQRILEHSFQHSIPDPLPVGPSPRDASDLMDVLWSSTASPSTLQPGMRWMLDFDQAVRAGMADRIPLTGSATQGFARLLVLGVKAAQNSALSSDQLATLFEAHYYSNSLGVVPPGTPTNNTPSVSAGYESTTSRTSEPLETEIRGAEPLRDDAAGPLAARLLGVPGNGSPNESVFLRAPYADHAEECDARHMNTSLWRASWGYYLQQQWDAPVSQTDVLRTIRRHFINYVRARGPLPTLRVRNQPYGLLPATTLNPIHWQGGEDVLGALADLLWKQRSFWLRAALGNPSTPGDGVPRPGRLPDVPNAGEAARRFQNMLEILGMQEHSSSFVARPLLGPHFLYNLGLQMDVGSSFRDSVAASLRTPDLTQHPTWDLLDRRGLLDSPVALGRYLADAFHVRAPLLRYPPGRDPRSADERYTEQDLYPPPDENIDIENRHPISYVALTDIERPFPVRFRVPELSDLMPDPLLFTLLRQSVYWEYVYLAYDALLTAGLRSITPYKEPELVGIGAANSTPPPEVVVDQFTDELLGGDLGAFAPTTLDPSLFSRDAWEAFDEFWESVRYLVDRPVDVLEGLLPGTIDLASTRLDAWMTSLATRRLQDLRETHPEGTILGGYGWVENLRPPIQSPSPPDGFIHAPSINHATSAAILRSGFLAHRHDASTEHDPLALDLSSERMQTALELLEGVRQGQSLGALLGYRFERALHEGYPTLELDSLIPEIRRYAPLVGGKQPGSGNDGTEAKEVIGPTNVVDGLSLMRKRDAVENDLDNIVQSLSRNHDDAKEAIKTEIDSIENAVDAIADLTVAEGVHQAASGNPTRGGATLDAVARGEAVPSEFDVVRTPRTGIGLTHRIIMLGSGSAQTPTDWPASSHSFRSAAAPRIERWAADLLGPPSRIGGQATYRLAESDAAVETRDVTLADLNVGALDALFLADSGDEPRQSALEQRLAYFLLQSPPTGGDGQPMDPLTLDLELHLQRQPATSSNAISFAAFLETARALRMVFTEARPLDARDLHLPETANERGIDAVELQQRADSTRSKLLQASKTLRGHFDLPSNIDPDALPEGVTVDNLLDVPQTDSLGPLCDTFDLPALTDLQAVREALIASANFGIQGATPLRPVGDTSDVRAELAEQARSVAREMKQRLAASNENDSSSTDKLQAIFGDGFPVIPRFQLAASTKLKQAFGESDSLQGLGSMPHAAPPVTTWIQRIAHVRERVSHLHDALLYAEAVTDDVHLNFTVGQRPFSSGDRWIGLDNVSAMDPPRGRLSIAAYTSGEVDLDQPLSGLMIDEWTEVIPSEEETTGMTFQFDAPGNRAPQAILLAVSPDPDRPWTQEMLEDVLQETLELAKIRSVDLDALFDAGHFLPAWHF